MKRVVPFLFLWIAAGQVASSDIPELQQLRVSYGAANLEIDIESQQRFDELDAKYLSALSRLETTLKENGQEDEAGLVASEIRSIENGSIREGAREDDPVAELRAVYGRSREEIVAERNAKREAKTKVYRTALEELIADLENQARQEEAGLVQKELEELPSQEDTIAKVTPDGPVEGIERKIKLPEEWPPVVEDPFAENDWKEHRTVPAGEYRLRSYIKIGTHNSGTRVFLAPGGTYTYYEGNFHVYGGRLYAESCSFSGIPFRADHSGGMVFLNSRLKDCNTAERGNWWGSGNYDSKWYFENCRISGNFSHDKRFNINYYGLLMNRCSLERVELPEIWFNEKEPAVRIKDTWLTVENCHFEKCKIPLSFLLITKNCTFVDCRLEDDQSEKENEFKESVEVTVFTSDCINTIRKAPPTVTLIEQPISALGTVTGSLLPAE